MTNAERPQPGQGSEGQARRVIDSTEEVRFSRTREETIVGGEAGSVPPTAPQLEGPKGPNNITNASPDDVRRLEKGKKTPVTSAHFNQEMKQERKVRRNADSRLGKRITTTAQGIKDALRGAEKRLSNQIDNVETQAGPQGPVGPAGIVDASEIKGFVAKAENEAKKSSLWARISKGRANTSGIYASRSGASARRAEEAGRNAKIDADRSEKEAQRSEVAATRAAASDKDAATSATAAETAKRAAEAAETKAREHLDKAETIKNRLEWKPITWGERIFVFTDNVREDPIRAILGGTGVAAAVGLSIIALIAACNNNREIIVEQQGLPEYISVGEMNVEKMNIETIQKGNK